MKRIMFYGGSSMMAYMWANYWKNKYEIFLVINTRWVDIQNTHTYKISGFEDLNDKLIELKIDTLINCAGLTNVEDCELNPKKSKVLNTNIPEKLSKISNNLNINYVQISTDHLFDGNNIFYTERSVLNPINQYAKSKAEGENKVLQNNSNALIIRTNFFGKGPEYKSSFSDFIIKSLIEKKIVKLFSDVYYTPISIIELIDIIEHLIFRKKNGIYHVSSNERISKYQFGLLICEKLSFSKSLIKKDYLKNRKNLVKRPFDMSLSNHKVRSELGLNIKSLKDQIDTNLI